MTTNQTAPVSDEELDQMIRKLERDGMTPKQLSLMRELREVRRAKGVYQVMYGECWRDVTEEQYHDHAIHESPIRIVYATPPAPVVPDTFMPKNLDRALGVVGVALPESKEEFNFQIERWTQRLIDRVIRYADEFCEPPAPVVPCPYPCGWDNLNKYAIQDAAFVARGLVEGEEVTEAHRHAVIANNDRLLRVIASCCAAMLQLSGNSEQLEPVSNRDELPATQFKPVADLYGITSPTGSETSFTFDAIEAANFIEGGWSVQEYVELERYQESMIGNSPATPDGWISVSERMPERGEDVLAYRPDAPESNDPLIKMSVYVGKSAHGHGFDCYCKPSHWMPLPAAPNFREISNSSTNNCREITETSTNCHKCGGRGTYHCPQMLGTVECECTLPAAPKEVG